MIRSLSRSHIASNLRRGPELARRWLAARIHAVLAAAVFAAMSLVAVGIPAWQGLERRVFDFLTVYTAPGELKNPITLVGLNEEAMNAMKMRLPWPRKVYADLIERIASGGAVVIAMDFLFAEPSEGDDKLAEAIRKAGNVVLVAADMYDETGVARIWKRLDPLPVLMDAGAMAGYAKVPFDPDNFVRQVPDSADAFWRQVVKIVQVKAPALAVPPLPESDALMRYMGPENSMEAIPIHLVLEASPQDLKTAFNGRIVIVGRDLQATAEIGMAQADMFATPFLPYSGGLTPGIKIHANLVDNALSGMWLRSSGLKGSVLASALAALLAFFSMRRWRPFVGLGALLAIVGAFGGLTWYAFTRERLWIGFATPAATAVLVYLAYMVHAYLIESKRKREIQAAFSRFVSPEVVRELADNPELLRLGGRRREITLMFTDLAGFTTLTEKSDPEVVQQVLKKHFTMLTGVIFDHQGTVVQFAGDGLMSFWGAPLDDAEHGYNAVLAAIAAQKGMEELRRELREAGLPEIKMRVGLNTCEAMVGNFGSEKQMVYTAMGDGVNLSSRLEGANKLYGTPILVSGETVAKVKGRIPMRRVDRIRVAGKSLPVDVFTPIEDAQRAERTAIAFEAYVRGDLDTATAIYSELKLTDEEDKVASRFLERIEKLRKDPSIVDENGSIALDKM